MFELKSKVAIVTGGNGGIGLGMARGLAQAGARVVIAARKREKNKSKQAGSQTGLWPQPSFKADPTRLIVQASTHTLPRVGGPNPG